MRKNLAGKRIFMIQALFLLMIAFFSVQCVPEVPDGRRLRDIVGDLYPDGNVLIGATTGSRSFSSGTTNDSLVMDREYMYVTPADDFKQTRVHPAPGVWDWSQADPWKQHIIENVQILRMHCPIGPQCSNWAKEDSRTAAELEANLREFMQGVCERYNGEANFTHMDVVNETLIQGEWHENKAGNDWECPWFIMGQDNDPNQTPLFIKAAFEIADQYAPDLKLIFNHQEGPDVDSSWLKIAQTVEYLRGQGLRVDGIGWQAHVDQGWDTTENLEKLRDLIDWAHDNNLEFHVTEASVWLKHGNTPSEQEKQAVTYRNIVRVMLEKRFNGVVAWNTWHISDNRTWRFWWHPAVFDWFYKAKPAYYAIQSELEAPS